MNLQMHNNRNHQNIIYKYNAKQATQTNKSQQSKPKPNQSTQNQPNYNKATNA